MSTLITKKGYKSELSLLETQKAIKHLKDFFQTALAKKLQLTRVSAPLFVKADTGLNDNLSGWEKAVTFETRFAQDLQIVHSLAKWKRKAIKSYGLEIGEGLYADMNAIRTAEVVSNIHSIYVDQWDWEKSIAKEDRSDAYLEKIVSDIFAVFKETEKYINAIYPFLSPKLPEKITFITSQELLDMYPDYTDKERETAIVKKYGAVFLKQIGDKLSSGEPHDMRAPDYDDWALNGDILVYNKPLDSVLELSSMGIRVSEESLVEQLIKADAQERLELPFHKELLAKELPYTVGGGIGQSRLCMFFLEKIHIGEVQSSVWPEEMIIECKESGIELL
ncbi:aspartate--ammonia ligase [Mycoplasma sp. P36-A1]|uniref:aspartate--ammonia ligase n=1 Tax=Mycoplasma sp. P36-A1 TaxID=3252900 RepID=UPI003C2C5836